MPAKTLDIEGIGQVDMTKRRSSRNLRLSFGRDGSLKVSLPYYVPYRAAVEFVKSKRDWIAKHRPTPSTGLSDGDRVGKAHRLKLQTRTQKPESSTVSVKVKDNQVIVTCPVDVPHTHVKIQKAAERGALKALKLEADQLLPRRLCELAKKHNFTYKSVSTKRLSSRWGSCSQHGDIILNIYLMQLPWELIDYVILHELVHTEHLNHSQGFWNRFEQILPDAKSRRKLLKTYKTVVTAAS